jgi:hypothetical protein
MQRIRTSSSRQVVPPIGIANVIEKLSYSKRVVRLIGGKKSAKTLRKNDQWYDLKNRDRIDPRDET